MNIDIAKTDSLSGSSDKLEILFLDTFSSNIEERSFDDLNKRQLNVGLVQFKNPVIIHELRIIPLSTLVSAESLGVRLGATNPSSFEIHFYINDLKAKEASTFLDIGSFSYKEYDRFIFKPALHVATDGLFLKGHFESVTLAVLGIATDLSTLVQKDLPSTSNKVSNDSNDSVKESIEIKEPDEPSDCDEPVKSDPSEVPKSDIFNDNSNSEHFVIKEEVHSLSPSPEITRIRSPSPHYNLSTPKSRSSTSSHERTNKHKELNYGRSSRHSLSRSNSISPSRYSGKNQLNELSPISHHYRSSGSRRHPSTERERDLVKSSSHLRDRYDDERYSSTSSRHNKRSPEHSSRSYYYSSSSGNKYEHERSRSSRHYRSERSSSRQRRSRDRSVERNESVHSDTRDDNRSMSSLNSRTRSSGGHYDLNDSNLSPKHRSRRSRSTSRKRSYHRDSYSPSNDVPPPPHSPESKKSRHESPTTQPRFNNQTGRSPSPKVQLKIECISSPPPKSHNDELVIKEEHTRSSLEMSPAHSSISNMSLKSQKITADQPADEGKQIELFEPLSPSDNLSDLEAVPEGSPTVIKTEIIDNYEEISLSSDDVMNDADEEVKTENDEKGELLEVISSDEEYDDELNAALSSDKIDYAKNYLVSTGDKYDDDEIDNCFDINKNLFDPFLLNQLQCLQFPFNSNSSTFIDVKLFNSIRKFVESNFGSIYSADCDRKELIDDVWVENVEQLASDLMKLTSPIYCSFNKDDSLVNTEQELRQLVLTLISITKDGLDYELATSQKKIPFKVRHLKAGIKLLVALFSSLDFRSKETNFKLSYLLFEADLPFDLLQLYSKPYMSMSLRLLVLNGLIVICDYPEGVHYLLTKKFDWSQTTEDCDEVGSHCSLTSYQYILTLIMAQKKTRLTYVFEELLEKIHLYELFHSLSSVSEDTLKQMCNLEEIDGDRSEPVNVYAMLVQVVTFFNRLSNRIHRPLRLLPNICQYEIKTAVHTSIPLLLLASTFKSNSQPNIELFHYIKTRFSCMHISCTSSKIGFISQKAFYRYFKHFNLLQFLATLLKVIGSSKHSHESSPVFHLSEVVITLLDSFTSHQQGLKFLLESEHTSCTNEIHQCLVNKSTAGLLRNRLSNFGVKFITRLYTFQLVDKVLNDIYRCHMEAMQKSDTESCLALNFFKNGNHTVIDSLLKLFTMIYLDQAVFRDAVISTLTMEHNFDAIISFIIPITSQFDSSKPSLISDKISIFDSISFVYATKIASACIQYLPEKNLIHFFDSYGKSFLKNIENVQSLVQSSSLKLHKSDILQSQVIRFSSLINWLSPLKNGNLNSHDELTIRMFVTILKKHHDSCLDKFYSIDNTINRVFFIEPELITAIKILVSLCDPTSDYAKNQDPDIQLKYRYSLVHCYYYDCMSYLLKLLDATSETCLRPSHQTYAYSFNDSYINMCLKSFVKNNPTTTNTNGSNGQSKQHSIKQQQSNTILHQGSMILEFIRPSIRLLKLILNFLLESMGHMFSDSTPVPVLLKIYYFLDAFREMDVTKCARWKDVEIDVIVAAKQIQKEIIGIIHTVYTSVFVKHSETENSLKKSVWTKMIRHVFEFISTSPKYFACGLKTFSLILPEILPFKAGKSITDTETNHVVNFRKLWAAHLHIFSDEIELLFRFFPLSDSVDVQRELRNVCHKLCDLYTPTVVTVAKSITECLVNNLNTALCVDGCPSSLQKQYFQNCAKVLDLIFDLFFASVSFRIAILNSFFYASGLDGPRSDPSSVAQFISKLFEFLNRNKLAKNVQSDTFFKDTLLTNEEVDSIETQDLSRVIEKYFQLCNNAKIGNIETFAISDKSISKFVSNCTKSLNEYFGKRTVYLNNSGECDESMANDTSVLEDFKEESTAEELPITKEKDNRIYTQEFVQLSLSVMPISWIRPDFGNADKSELTSIDLVELSKKYFNTDYEGLKAILNTLYSPIVEPEPPEKPNEETNKLTLLPNTTTKRNSQRGRGRNMFGHRLNDPFRSRPPNTSRPPSMHVDDFVALQQRQDPLVLPNLNSKSRLQLHLNSVGGSGTNSPYSKHSDYHRKKGLSSHHSHSHLSYSSYSNSLKSNMVVNSSNSLNSNTSHYSKQP